MSDPKIFDPHSGETLKKVQSYLTTCSSTYVTSAVPSSAYQTTQSIYPRFPYNAHEVDISKNPFPSISADAFKIQELDPEIDAMFRKIFEAYLQKGPHEILEIEEKIFDIFNKIQNNPDFQDKYFTNFTPIWKFFLATGHLDWAESIWPISLKPALEWEKNNPGRFIHKGTLFYFWGVTAILMGDLDKGFNLIHRAVEEDRRKDRFGFRDKPAFALVTLNYDKSDQFFLDWVSLQAQFLDKLIKEYCRTFDTSFGLKEFYNRFLSDAQNLDSVFLFTYSLARILRLVKMPEYILANMFSSQLRLNMLFDITVVIGEAVKKVEPGLLFFKPQMSFISKKANFNLDDQKLRKINGSFKNDFEGTLRNLLASKFTLDGYRLSKKESDLTVTYGIRNQGAHSSVSASIISDKFEELFQSVFNTLFLCIEKLYSNSVKGDVVKAPIKTGEV